MFQHSREEAGESHGTFRVRTSASSTLQIKVIIVTTTFYKTREIFFLKIRSTAQTY